MPRVFAGGARDLVRGSTTIKEADCTSTGFLSHGFWARWHEGHKAKTELSKQAVGANRCA